MSGRFHSRPSGHGAAWVGVWGGFDWHFTHILPTCSAPGPGCPEGSCHWLLLRAWSSDHQRSLGCTHPPLHTHAWPYVPPCWAPSLFPTSSLANVSLCSRNPLCLNFCILGVWLQTSPQPFHPQGQSSATKETHASAHMHLQNICQALF